MTARQLWFTGPGEVEIREVPLGEPGPGEVLVRTALCGISAGTERLLWRGEFPEGIVLDEGIPSLNRPSGYPCPYGYCLAGRVDGRESLVLVFHPHADEAVVKEESLIPLPPDWTPEQAVFLPNAETAFNLVLDAAPRAGERVAVLGLGVVGRLLLGMLGDFPLDRLWGVDPSSSRRARAADVPGAVLITPGELPDAAGSGGADLVVEVSGRPEALQAAVDVCGYGGRVVAGSWYGSKNVALDLGSGFHRKRLQLVSSQVSTIAPELRGRWDHRRRMNAAADWLGRRFDPSWITHRFPLADAASAYRLMDGADSGWFQVVLEP